MPEIKKIDHIGIGVESIDETGEVYTDYLGMEIEEIEVVEDQKVRTAMIPCGDVEIELLEPTEEDSPIARFLSKRGPGIHHIAYEVDNLEKKLDELKEKGVKLIDEEPRVGAGGKRIAFIHPKVTDGVLTELCEK